MYVYIYIERYSPCPYTLTSKHNLMLDPKWQSASDSGSSACILKARTLKPYTFGWFSTLGSLAGSFCIRVPYYIGDLTRDPNLENFSFKKLQICLHGRLPVLGF